VPLSGQTWDLGRFAPQPALSPFGEMLSELCRLSAFPDGAALSRWVEATRGEHAPELEPLRFVEVRPRPRRAKRGVVELAELYDARITCSSEVPCLSQSYHDLFNALMFKAFPRAKRALHARQYRALTGWAESGTERLPGRRTREQDALTLFDEGGSVVVCPTQLEAAFEAGAVLPLAEAGASAKLVLFGHAVCEHLSEGQTGLRSSARVLFLPEVPDGTRLLEVVDAFIERLVRDPRRFQAPDADAVVFLDSGPRASFRRFDPLSRAGRVPARAAIFESPGAGPVLET
jgi:hypothetical protein